MNIFKKIVNTTKQKALSILVKKNISIGKEVYERRRLLPNWICRSLQHEAFLDDIYIAALKKKEGAVIDVGANKGQTLFKMLSLDKNRPYFGFEPQCTSASCIESFLIENKIKNYFILPIALSDRNGCIPLLIRGTELHSMASTTASVIKGFRPDSFYNYKKHIYAARGDEVIENLNIPSIALIKIDVEGAELDVIKGLQMTIEKHRPFMLFEVLHHYLAVTKENLDNEMIDFRELRIKKLEELIRAKRYLVYQINEDKEIVKIAKIEPKDMNDLASTDYIAVPEEEESDFCASIKTTRRITIG